MILTLILTFHVRRMTIFGIQIDKSAGQALLLRFIEIMITHRNPLIQIEILWRKLKEVVNKKSPGVPVKIF